MQIIGEYSLSRAILISELFQNLPMAEQYRALQRRLGHDFSAIIALCDRLGPFLSGEEHKVCRKFMAMRLAEVRPLHEAGLYQFLDTFAATRLRAGERFDLFADFSAPMFRAMIEPTIAGADLPPTVLDLVDDIPWLFAMQTPLKKRIAINQALSAAIAGRSESVLDHIAVLVLGIRPLTGSLGLSLHRVFSDQPGVALRDMRWPETFVDSSLQYADRIAQEPVRLGEVSIAEGERVRCLVQDEAWSAQERQSTLFGVGKHLCLGRPLSELVWQQSVACFSRHALFARITPLQIRTDSEPFRLSRQYEVVLEQA